MILDHIGLAVRDFNKSAAFFRRALAPLGIQTVLEGEGWAMLGKDGRPEFWIGVHGIPPGPIHIAFAAENREHAVAEVRTAVALDDSQRQRIGDALSRATGKQVEVKVVIDASVLGGIVATIGDTVIDGTVRHRLDQLKEQI